MPGDSGASRRAATSPLEDRSDRGGGGSWIRYSGRDGTRAHEFGSRVIYGLDLSPDRLDRATRVISELIAPQSDRLVLQQGSALNLQPRRSISYSVEAAQHFEDLAVFASETHRVLKSGGRLAIALFFMTEPDRNRRTVSTYT
jgi:ubiquinone/menaquinone biosynthesis C-methylase UbiE